MIRTITIVECGCEKCGHIWRPKVQDKVPEICPRCKTKRWNLRVGGEIVVGGERIPFAEHMGRCG